MINLKSINYFRVLYQFIQVFISIYINLKIPLNIFQNNKQLFDNQIQQTKKNKIIKMNELNQNQPTFTFRKICEKIENKIQQHLLTSFNQNHIKQTNQYGSQISLLENIKADLIRIITSELPSIVNYQNKLNEKLLDFQQQRLQLTKQLQLTQQTHKTLIVDNDKLKVTNLQLERRINHLEDDKIISQQRYNEALLMAKKYMMRNQELQQEKISKDKDKENDYDLPLQIKEKLNRAENTSKLIRDNPKSQEQHLNLTSEIIDCQKQLLEYQLRESLKQITSLKLRLEQEVEYTTKLQKQTENLQKLLEGERKLKENIDKELYCLMNSNKQIKVEMLEGKAKVSELQQQVNELEEELKMMINENKQLKCRVGQLEQDLLRMQKKQEELIEVKAQLEISEKKYQELRKLKLELEERVEEFELKLQEIQKRQSEQQFKNTQLQFSLKQQNLVKIKQIQQMAGMIKEKYQKKINILQLKIKQIKEKYKFLKQENSRLYEGLETQAKKQLRLEGKFNRMKERLEQVQGEIVTLRKDKELLEEKVKTQIMLNKDLKRQVNVYERVKEGLERKLSKIKISILPRLLNEIRQLKCENQKIRTFFDDFKELFHKSNKKSSKEFEKILDLVNSQYISKQSSLQLELKSKLNMVESLKKQNQELCSNQAQLSGRINVLEENNKTLHSKLKISQQTRKSLQDNLQIKDNQNKQLSQLNSKLQEKTHKLQKQIQNFIKTQQTSTQQIQLLKQKQNQVEKFYDLIEQITAENNQLKEMLIKYQKNQKSKYTIAYSNNSNSCVHLQNSLNKKSACTYLQPTNLTNLTKPSTPSLDKKHLHMYNDMNTKSHLIYNNKDSVLNIRPESRPVFYSRTNLKPDGLSHQNDEQMRIRSDFEAQKQRLDEIKREYQKIMVDKIRQEHHMSNHKKLY